MENTSNQEQANSKNIKNILKENIGFIIIAIAFSALFYCSFTSLGRIIDDIFNARFLYIYIFTFFVIIGIILTLKNFFDFLAKSKKIGKKVSKLSIINFICSFFSFIFIIILPLTILIIEELGFFIMRKLPNIFGSSIFSEIFILSCLSLFVTSIILGILNVREINKHKEKLFEKQLVKKSFAFILLLSFILVTFMISTIFSFRPTPSQNVFRKSNMRDIITAQEMYYGANGAYFTAPFSNAGTHTIPGYLDARSDVKCDDDKQYPDYVWLKNDGDVSDCITGEYFCVYATAERNPEWYVASEKGTKTITTLPGSIDGIYGIDHCNCFDTQKQTEIFEEKLIETERETENHGEQNEEYGFEAKSPSEIFCEENFEHQYQKRDCYEDLAKEKKDETICENITTELYKDICYRETAFVKNDENICDKITSKDTWIKTYCYIKIAKKRNEDAICDKLSDDREKDACYHRFASDQDNKESCAKIISLTKRDDCYNSFALKRRDVLICEQIENLSSQKNCKEHFIFDTSGWEIYTSNEHTFEFKIPPLFTRIGYRIEEKKVQKEIWLEGECDFILFNLHPIEPFRSSSANKDEFYMMFPLSICPKEYCQQDERTRKFCEILSSGMGNIDEDPTFCDFVKENEKFIVYKSSGSSSGDFSDAMGWGGTHKTEYQMLSSFRFLE